MALSTIVEVVWLMRVDNGRWFNVLLSSEIKVGNHVNNYVSSVNLHLICLE